MAAVSVCGPSKMRASGSRVFHCTVYGDVVTGAPTRTPSTRNSTLLTPTSSVALAVSVTGLVTVAPAAGAVIDPDGGWVLSTTTFVPVGVVETFPASSVAVSVMVCCPLPTAPEFQVASNGAVVSLPTVPPSTKNSTDSTRRSSPADAANLTVLPDTRASAAGEASSTRGFCVTLPS